MTDPLPLDTWIGQSREPSEVSDNTWLQDPNTGEDLQASRSSSSGQVDRALHAADRVHRQGAWMALGVAGRATYLARLAAALDARTEEIARADALSSGVPLDFTRMFAASLGDTVRSIADLAVGTGDVVTLPADQGPVRLHRVPWGPTALIVPWNAPAALAVKKAAFALVAGAPVVLKPSPVTPWSAQLLAEAVLEADLPDGVFNLVLGGGAVGEQLCADDRIRAIAMTGSTATGRLIARTAAPRFARLRLELGSNNPVVVREDADVDRTAAQLYAGMTKLNGAWCEAPRNVFVHERVAADLLEALRELVTASSVGHSLETGTRIGPMPFQAHRDTLVAQRERWRDAGHDCWSATTPDLGWFFAPTVVHGTSVEITNEVFGPMLTVEPVSGDDQALEKARRSAGGLAAYVFSEDVEAGLRLGSRLTGGEVKLNGTSLLDMSPASAQSFFGSSGVGGHGDLDVLEFHTGKQVVGVDLIDPPL